MPAREESGEPADASAGGKRKEAYGLADACAGKNQPDGKNLEKKIPLRTPQREESGEKNGLSDSRTCMKTYSREGMHKRTG